MDPAEFRDLGLLQEVNRRLLHPLGLALAVAVADEDGTVRLDSILDWRDDPEGVIFGDVDDDFVAKALAVDDMWKQREPARRQALGYMVQPRRPEANHAAR